MKQQFNHLKLLLPALLIVIALSSAAQNSFTHIASKENRAGNGECTRLDNKELDNNPRAILFVTQKEQGINPHPIAAFYFQGKWNIMNLDQAAIPAGSTFMVEYFTKSDADHFQYLITKETLQRDGSALIDHPALNKNPNAQFSSFHSWVPEAKEYANREAVSLKYNPEAEKWSVSNINKKSLVAGLAYNIVINEKGTANNSNSSLAPNGNAGGDLAGTYPNPSVQKLLGRPLSLTAPSTGQVLKWNGTDWAAANDEVGSNTKSAAAWSLSGNNLINTNTGNVGIGNNNPAYRLDVSGPMLVRSSGATTGSAGIWLNDDYNYKAALIGMENDNHVGFFGVGINGWKFSMNTNTGALKINGSEGKPGQVLVSNAPAAPNYTSIGNVIRTEIKKGSGGVEAKVPGTDYHLPQLTHTITLTAKSKIIISAQMSVTANCSFYLCDASSFHLLLKVGNSIVFDQQYSATMVSIQPSICNYIIELDAGTHSLNFYDRFMGGNTHWINPTYSSIIILPVD